MVQLPARHTKSVAHLPQALGLSELTKEHRDSLAPARKTFAVPFRLGLADGAHKRICRNDLENLAEEAGTIRHGRGFSLEVCCLPNHHSTTAGLYPTSFRILFWTGVSLGLRKNSFLTSNAAYPSY